jgi:hypothetical protein
MSNENTAAPPADAPPTDAAARADAAPPAIPARPVHDDELFLFAVSAVFDEVVGGTKRRLRAGRTPRLPPAPRNRTYASQNEASRKVAIIDRASGGVLTIDRILADSFRAVLMAWDDARPGHAERLDCVVTVNKLGNVESILDGKTLDPAGNELRAQIAGALLYACDGLASGRMVRMDC